MLYVDTEWAGNYFGSKGIETAAVPLGFQNSCLPTLYRHKAIIYRYLFITNTQHHETPGIEARIGWAVFE